MYSGPLDHNFLHRRGSSIADRWKREKRRIFAVLSCLKLRTHDGWCLQLTKSRVLQRTRAIGLRGSCAGPGRSNQNSVSITKKKNTHKYWMKLNRISSKQMLFKINISIIVYDFLTVSHKTCFFLPTPSLHLLLQFHCITVSIKIEVTYTWRKNTAEYHN